MRGIPELLSAIGRGRLGTEAGSASIADLVSAGRTDADALRLQDIGRGDRLLLEGRRGAALFGRVLAAWSIGAVPVLAPAGLAADEWPGPAALWSWRGTEADMLRNGTAEDDPAALVHASSGSTGRPKLARRSFESLLAEAERYCDRYRLASGESAYVAAPIDHSFAFGALLGLLSAGATVDLAPVFHPRRLAGRLRSGEVDVAVVTATMARLAVEAAAKMRTRSGRPPRLVIAGAGAVPDDLDKAFRSNFGCGLARNYGASETGATFGEMQPLGENRLGRPFPGVSIVAPGPDEAEGELVLDLGHPVLGPEGEAPAHEAANIWRTGDLVRIEPGGTATLLGRLADRLKINGRSIDGARLAALARATEGVRDALALALPRPDRPETADLILACEAEAGVCDAVLRRIREHGGGMPVKVVTFASFPRTAAGKIDRAALTRSIEERRRARTGTKAASPEDAGCEALEPAG